MSGFRGAESFGKRFGGALARLDGEEELPLLFLQRLRRHLVPRELLADAAAQHILRRIPRHCIVVLEREVDDGILPLLGHPFVRVLALRDRPRLEEVTHVRLVRAALLEEALEHLHRGGLAEAARTRKEHRARARRKEVADEESLIDAIAMLGHFLPEALADRDRKQPAPCARRFRHVFHAAYSTKTATQRQLPQQPIVRHFPAMRWMDAPAPAGRTSTANSAGLKLESVEMLA